MTVLVATGSWFLSTGRALRRSGLLLLLLACGLCASLWMNWILSVGPGVSPDSTVYLETARNLLSGNGFSVDGRPLTHFPPCYPLLLAGVGLVMDGDVLLAAHWLCVILFGLNLVLLGATAFLMSGRNSLATFLAVLFFSLSPSFLMVHSMAWSEAPFLAFLLTSVVLLSVSLAQDRAGLLLLSAITLGCAVMTRYAGIAAFPAMAVALLVFGDRPLRERSRRALLYFTVALSPLLMWLARNLVVAASATNRSFRVHPFDSHDVTMLVTTVWEWFLPITSDDSLIRVLVGGCGLLVLIGTLVVLGKETLRRPRRRPAAGTVFVIVCMLFLISYLAFLLVSISFLDAHTSINQRIMVPALVLITVAGIAVSARWRPVLPIALVLLSLSTVLHVREAVLQVVHMHQYGQGYTERAWVESEVITYLKKVADDRLLYTNGPDVLRFLLHRRTTGIPGKVVPTTREANPHYTEQTREMIRQCKNGTALIAYLDRITWRWYLPTREELVDEGHPPVLRTFRDGVIFGVPRGPSGNGDH